MLHVIVASDERCNVRLRRRNETKPEGLYYGNVTEAQFEAITRYFVPPSDAVHEQSSIAPVGGGSRGSGGRDIGFVRRPLRPPPGAA